MWTHRWKSCYKAFKINWKKFNAENKLANQSDCVNSFCYPFYCQMRVIHRMAANYQFSDVFSIILMSKISVNLICRSGYYTVCAVHSDYRCFLILEFIFSLNTMSLKALKKGVSKQSMFLQVKSEDHISFATWSHVVSCSRPNK